MQPSDRSIQFSLAHSAGRQTFQLDKLKLEIDGPKPQTAGSGFESGSASGRPAKTRNATAMKAHFRRPTHKHR